MNAYLTLIKEKGLGWFVNRSLYSLKLKCLNHFPITEAIFEKKVPKVERIDIFDYQVNQLCSFLNALSQNDKEIIIHKADLACKGIVYGFSSIKMDYGFPIDWQLNPITGKSCNVEKKWYQIPDFDKDRGDIKAIWEISRFSHFFDLARAFLLTNDRKYVDAYFGQIGEWVNNNPYSFGANYKCGQECSLRLISILFTFPCFRAYAVDKDIENIKIVVDGSYRKVLSNFFYAYRCIRNNHTISELVGMIIGSWCCMDEKRTRTAYEILEKVILEQFLPDGGYTQQSFNYQRLALMDLEIVLSLETKTGFNLSEVSKKRIISSVLQLYLCQDKTGDVPNYGSNDGALILPLTVGTYRDYRPGINAIHALIYGTPLYADRYLEEELIWLNRTNIQQYSNASITRQVSTDFPDTGLSVFRNNHSWMMVVCKKEMHHMDNGHIDLWVNGKNVICDAGSYSYASELGRELYTNKAHNTLYCTGMDQIRRIGAFSVYGQPCIKKRIFKNDSIEFDIEYSTGYGHKREVRVDNGRYEIIDEGIHANRECFVNYHVLGPVHEINDRCIELEDCIMTFSAPFRLSKSKRSLFYLQTEDTTCISVICSNPLRTIIEIKGEINK